MVALLHESPAGPRRSGAPRLRLIADVEPVAETVAPVAAPALRLVPSPDDGVRAPGVTAGAVVAVAVAVLTLFAGVRAIQGGPPAGSIGGSAAEPTAEAIEHAGLVVVVQPGDTLWSIATGLAPDEDPRPVVAALIEVNGGESLRIGQQIVIPSHLVE
ncbi:MAG: LysM peptidoglycan-binding domain-containing protein [Actinomycetota bacterium]